MAPRSRSRATQAASNSPPACSIADLPDAVLVDVMGCLTLAERQRAALVCKRFAAAACNAALLHEVDLPEECCGVQKLQSFASWLARHGRHVRKLRFWVDAAANDDESGLAAATATCMAIVGTAAQLTELTVISMGGDPLRTEWLPAMRSLQRLTLHAASLLHITPAACNTALQSLRLVGGTLQFAPGARLPASITRLRVDDRAEALPDRASCLDCACSAAKIVELPRLQRLMLQQCSYSTDSLSRLSALSSSLTRLELWQMQAPIGAAMSALSGLQRLDCQVEDEGTGQAVAAALPHLTGLTCLVLWGGHKFHPLPRALSGLSQLRLCSLDVEQEAADGQDVPPLPGGPWLRSLRWLSADLSTLLRSTAVLRAATGLESLSVLPSSGAAELWSSPAAAAFFDWVTGHPPLQRLSLEGEADAYGSLHFVVQIVHLCHRRPGLLVQCPAVKGEGESLDRFLSRTDCF